VHCSLIDRASVYSSIFYRWHSVAVRSGSSAAGVSHEFVNNLQTQLRESVAQMEGLEKERDFYFAKLRDIEILVQNQLELLESEDKDEPTLREIQKILYSTEEGFEPPEVPGAVDEEETF